MKKDSLAIDGKMYISSRRASEIAGYSKDYVGQLCRSGKLECRMVGRLWYVGEESLRKHQAETIKANQTSFRPAGFVLAPLPQVARFAAGPFSVPANIPGTFSARIPAGIPSPLQKDQATDKRAAKRTFLVLAIVVALFVGATTAVSMGKIFNGYSGDNPASAYDASVAHGGLVVVPSSGASSTDAKLAQSIINSFSDDVTVAPGTNGTTGVITPEFRTVKGHDYLYVLVPVKTASTSPQDDSK